eukprot:543238-Pelagomonas_calceolata.AAC.6
MQDLSVAGWLPERVVARTRCGIGHPAVSSLLALGLCASHRHPRHTGLRDRENSAIPPIVNAAGKGKSREKCGHALHIFVQLPISSLKRQCPFIRSSILSTLSKDSTSTDCSCPQAVLTAP